MIYSHIQAHLEDFVKNDDPRFDLIFKSIVNSHKYAYRRVLCYVDKILNRNFGTHQGPLQFTNIHLDIDNEDFRQLLIEFIAIKFFFEGVSSDRNVVTDVIVKRLEELRTILKYRYKEIPSYVSSKKNARRTKKWEAERERTESLLQFYFDIIKSNENKGGSLRPNTVLNLLQRDFDKLLEILYSRPYAIPIENIDSDLNYVLLNKFLERTEIDTLKLNEEGYLSDEFENVVLVGCESKKVFQTFNHRELTIWESETGKLKSIFVITLSDDKQNFASLKSKLDRVQTRFHSLQKDDLSNSYLVLNNEIKFLSGSKSETQHNIDFFGENLCYIWDEFLDELNFFEGLYEFQSIKLLNIYALTFDKSYKEFLLNDLFGNTSNILSDETKGTLLEIGMETVSKLRSILDRFLEYQISSGFREHLINNISESSVLLISPVIRSIPGLFDRLKLSLNLKHHRVIGWKELSQVNRNSMLIILDYRDRGKYPYLINPNILELPDLQIVTIFLVRFLFQQRYQWANFNLSTEIVRSLNNSIRNEYFNWKMLSNECNKLRPDKRDTTNWDNEQNFDSERVSQQIKVTYKGFFKSKSYSPSELFIIRTSENEIYKVHRLEELLDDDFSELISVQLLEELYSDFNIYEKIANVAKEEKELQVIRNQYNLNQSEKAGKLWKILFQLRTKESSADAVFNLLKSFVESRNLKLVSQHTFTTYWLNPDSSSLIPREKKVFSLVCEFLQLPRVYYKIMLRLKNVEIQNSRNNGRQMNSLLSELINDGCFNAETDVVETLTPLKFKYLQNHDFDEIGFHTETLIEDLKALVELLKSYLKLTKVDNIKRI